MRPGKIAAGPLKHLQWKISGFDNTPENWQQLDFHAPKKCCLNPADAGECGDPPPANFLGHDPAPSRIRCWCDVLAPPHFWFAAEDAPCAHVGSTATLTGVSLSVGRTLARRNFTVPAGLQHMRSELTWLRDACLRTAANGLKDLQKLK
jgi:hypothetical protein